MLETLTSQSKVQNECVAKGALLISVYDVRDENARGRNKRQKTADKCRNSDCEVVWHFETVLGMPVGSKGMCAWIMLYAQV
jgi:hypothetical protein